MSDGSSIYTWTDGFKGLNTTNGTWTYTESSAVPIFTRTAAASTATIQSTFRAPHLTSTSVAADKAVKILSFAMKYRITTANDGAPSAVLSKVTKVSATVDTAATITQTLAISGDDAIGIGVGQYVATWTVTTPTWADDDSYYSAVISWVGDADGVLVLERGIEWKYQQGC